MRNKIVGTLVIASIVIAILIIGTALISTIFGQNTSLIGSGLPSEGFQLSARLDQEKLKSGVPVVLQLSLRNITKRELRVVETITEYDYEIEITNERGVRAPLTKRGQQLKDGPRQYTKVVSVKIAPGQEQQVKLEINLIYDITAKGVYSITARRKVPKLDRSGQAEVVSNPVKLEID